MSGCYPLVALAGVEHARLALLVGLVDPRLLSVLIGGELGSGKSALAMGFLDFVRRFDADVTVRKLQAPVDVEALTGGVDFARTLATRSVVRQRGVLDDADLVVVEHWQLLSPSAIQALQAFVERGGGLIATANEESPHPDWIASGVRAEMGAAEPSWLWDRIAWDRGVSRGDREQDVFGALLSARSRIDGLDVGEAERRDLETVALDLGVRGHRAGSLLVRAVRAHAALRRARAVGTEDLEFAIRCVYVPRATRLPAPPAESQSSSEPRPRPRSHGSPEPRESTVVSPSSVHLDEPRVRAAKAAAARSRGRHGSTHSSLDRGRCVSTRRAAGQRGHVAIAATLRRAALRPGQRPPVSIRPDDVMLRVHRLHTGSLHLFVVDASGSMAAGAMRSAKGAAIQVLRRAYTGRDAVAIVGFRGTKPELLVPPTRSVARARDCIERLPAGGGTPLVSALDLAAKLADRERRSTRREVRVWLWTDGRANVLGDGTPGSAESVAAEISEMCRVWRRLGIVTYVLDTRPAHDKRGDARQLADALGAEYLGITARVL